MKKLNFNRQKRIITGIIGLLVVATIGIGFYYNSVSAKAKEEATIQYISLQPKGSFYNEILNSTSEDGYLVDGLTEQQVQQFTTQLEDQINSLTKYNKKNPKNTLDLSPIDDLHNMIMDLEYKLAIEENLNKLLIYSNYLSDTNPQIKKVSITDDLADKNLEDFIEVVQSRTITKDKWYEKVQSLIDEMTKQLKQIEVATNKTSALFKGDTVKEDISSADYEEALVEVEKITREKDREELLKKLNQVKDYLEKQNEMNESSEVATEITEETYLLNSLDEARSYLAEHMPQAGGPQQFINGLITSEGYYSFDYQLGGGPEGVVWNRIIIDRNKNTISDEYLKTVPNEDMEDAFDYYTENTGSTLTQAEALQKAGNYHTSLGRPSATLFDTSGGIGGYTVAYKNGDFIYSYFVNDDGSVIDQGIAELIGEVYDEDEMYDEYDE
ncbi:hypothetical protein PML78_13250 (plasmid) [Enterococcus dispar]|uniref:hypothetical protein n=1 Tax=Enterococcus dispar TaxID=44009 RepID=UPI002330029E|nr:hypothetical protein [Enterococcus dispar]WCG34425.1 hypothetical protein PML78_13250 [Enterococcus dispar]